MVNPSCDLCKKTDADTHCLDCQEYLCTGCHRNHNAFKAMAEHKIVPASDVHSGRVTSKGRHCGIHDGEAVRYYCTTENRQVCQDCISLNICTVQHRRVSLKEAAKEQQTCLREKLSECERTKVQCQQRLSEIDRVQTDLARSKQRAFKSIEDSMDRARRTLKECRKKKLDVHREHSERVETLTKSKKDVESRLDGIQAACDLVCKLTEHMSYHEITYNFAAISLTLENIVPPSIPEIADEPITFHNSEPSVHHNLDTSIITSQLSTKSSSGNSWVKTHQFSTSPDLHILQGIAAGAGPDGDITVASQTQGAKVFTRHGAVKHTFRCIPSEVLGIAVTPDDRYIVTAHNKLLCYLKKGLQSSVIKSKYPSAFVASPANTVAVDNKARIIAGLQNGIVAIYYADGSLMTHFQTAAEPYFISVLSNHTLVVTFSDKKLALVNFSGKILRIIRRPPGASDWQPGSTCCTSEDEIFVIDEAPQCHKVHRYTSQGDYLGVVTDDVSEAVAIAMSRDGTELFVAEEQDMVKIFRRN